MPKRVVYGLNTRCLSLRLFANIPTGVKWSNWANQPPSFVPRHDPADATLQGVKVINDEEDEVNTGEVERIIFNTLIPQVQDNPDHVKHRIPRSFYEFPRRISGFAWKVSATFSKCVFWCSKIGMGILKIKNLWLWKKLYFKWCFISPTKAHQITQVFLVVLGKKGLKRF